MTDRPTEVTAIHTRLLRVTLEVEPSVAYWKNAELDVNRGERARLALEEGWFGDKTEARVRKLVDELSSRFDPFPEALAVLRDWPDISPATRNLVCHWHVQLTDPVYRQFTGELLVAKRQSDSPKLSREATGAWLKELAPSRWSEPTVLKYAGNLLTTAAEAALVSKPSRERQVLLPEVPDDALGYILHLLRGVDFEGTLLANSYLASVGLHGDVLEKRLQKLPGVKLRNGSDLDFEAESLSAWARTLPN